MLHLFSEVGRLCGGEILQEKSIPAGSYGSSYPGSRLVSRNQLACYICKFFLGRSSRSISSCIRVQHRNTGRGVISCCGFYSGWYEIISNLTQCQLHCTMEMSHARDVGYKQCSIALMLWCSMDRGRSDSRGSDVSGKRSREPDIGATSWWPTRENNQPIFSA